MPCPLSFFARIAVSKVLEIVVQRQVVQFFEANKLFAQQQHGFRKKHSTISAITKMHESLIEAKHHKKYSSLSLFDLSAGFDTIDHDIFCEKLSIYGCDKKTVTWFKSYLTDRLQIIQVGCAFSKPLTIEIGSPQGSVLSPLIFLILVSDFDKWLKHGKMYSFADDSTNFISTGDMGSLIQMTEEDCACVIEFMSSNNLIANSDKTELIISAPIKTNENYQYQQINVDGSIVKESKSVKLLGMHISNDLKWKHHVQELIKSLNHALFTLRWLRNKLSQNHLISVAHGIFMSKLTYGISVYAPTKITDEDKSNEILDSLQKLQNNAMRVILRKKSVTKYQKLNY